MVHFVSPPVPGNRDGRHLRLCKKQKSRRSRFECTVMRIVCYTVRFDLYLSIVRYNQGDVIVSNGDLLNL